MLHKIDVGSRALQGEAVVHFDQQLAAEYVFHAFSAFPAETCGKAGQALRDSAAGMVLAALRGL